MDKCCQRIEHKDFKDVMVIWGDFDDALHFEIANELHERGYKGLVITMPPGDNLATLDEAQMLKAGWIRADKELK